MKIYYNPRLTQLARQLRNNGTKSEIKLWGYLQGRQMMGYKFLRQKPIDAYIVDFFCNPLVLAIELDGYTHQFEEVYEKDIAKAQRLTALGITVLRFHDSDVMNNMSNVLRVLENFILDFEEGREAKG